MVRGGLHLVEREREGNVPLNRRRHTHHIFGCLGGPWLNDEGTPATELSISRLAGAEEDGGGAWHGQRAPGGRPVASKNGRARG